MNIIITTITFLLCLTMPMNFFGMLNVAKIEQSSTPKTYQQLIAALQEQRKITTADFISCLNDAKKNSLKILFISTNLIESSPLKDEILTLFEESINNPKNFINETDVISFQAYKIPTGFICLLNTTILKLKDSMPWILTTESESKGTALFDMFNIPPDINNENGNIATILNNQSGLLNAFYSKIINEKERIKKIAQEQSIITPVSSPELEKEVITEPVTAIPQPEKKEEPKKQTQLAERYQPIIEVIRSMGGLPVAYKNKADTLIKNLKAGSLDEKEIKEAENFFIDLDTRVKKIEEEKIKQIAPTDIPESPTKATIESMITAPPEKNLIPSIEGVDIYTIPLSKYAIKSLKSEEEKEETPTVENYE